MDILKAEIERKRKLLEEKKLVVCVLKMNTRTAPFSERSKLY